MDTKYLETFINPVRKCEKYKPKMGTNNRDGVDLTGFKALYGADPFYSWIGLDSDLMYAAHKAAGGMTSVYRQIGIGCERLFRQIIIDMTEYRDPKYAEWSYTTKTKSGKDKILSLDGRLEFSEIQNAELSQKLDGWLHRYCEGLDVDIPPNGVVFEVRQGYKSKDSKRQNGDIDNASVAWSKGYLPIFAIFSSQIDGDIVTRYRNSRCGILTGSIHENPDISLFAFCKEILGYDLANFFVRNSEELKSEITEILSKLLAPN